MKFFPEKSFHEKKRKFVCIKKWQIVWKREEKLLEKKESRNYRNKEKWNYLCSTAQKMKFCIKDLFSKCDQNILLKYVTKISPFVLSRTSLSCFWQLFTSFWKILLSFLRSYSFISLGILCLGKKWKWKAPLGHYTCASVNHPEF